MQMTDVKKAARHEAILSMLERESIAKQEHIVEWLRNHGFEVTQASVSRDLTELGVAKVLGIYTRVSNPYRLGSAIVSMGSAGPNLLVVRTGTGSAQRTGYEIDGLNLPEVIGTIAGDDTIFVATRSEADHAVIAKALGVKL